MNQNMKKSSLVLFFAMMLSVFASAKTYVYKEGITTLTPYVKANGKFTATSDCKVMIEAYEVFQVTYNEKSYDYSYVPGNDYQYVYEIDGVKSGTAITIASDYVINSNSVIKITVFAEGSKVPVNLLDVNPSNSKIFSWNTTGMITFTFNKQVALDDIKFVAGEYQSAVDEIHVSNSVGFNISACLNDALKTGALKSGEKFRIVVAGLCDAADASNKYGTDGTLEVEFTAPYPQNNFVKATVGETQLSCETANTYNFLSYYVADGEDGVFVFEFDDKISSIEGVTFRMGNIDLATVGKFHQSKLPYKIEDNKVIVDARGTLRTLGVLFPAMNEEEAGEGEEDPAVTVEFDKEHATIILENVMDSHGNAFLSTQQGVVGSYSFFMGYQEIIDEAFLDGDNKADGDDVKSGEFVSLWLSNANIKFEGLEVGYFVNKTADGVQFEEHESQLVTDFESVEDPTEGVVISFTMPDMGDVAVGTVVRVALHNASSADGMPHYLYIEFRAADVANAISSVEKTVISGKSYRLTGVESGNGKGIVVRDGKKLLAE